MIGVWGVYAPYTRIGGFDLARTNLNFHQTFKPERQYISGLLSEIECCNGLDIQEISNQTGIPTGKSSGKVEPTISYAEYMGLIKKQKCDGKYELEYTALGECIRDEDSGLLEKLTLLMMHCMIVRPYGGAELWAYIIHSVFPKYRNSLTIKQFEKEIELMRLCGGRQPRILVGVSRKSMIYKPLGITPEDSLTQTQVLHLAALERGASILRVHDVAETARTVCIYRMLHGRGFNGLSHGIGGNKDVIPGTGRTLRQ